MLLETLIAEYLYYLVINFYNLQLLFANMDKNKKKKENHVV